MKNLGKTSAVVVVFAFLFGFVGLNSVFAATSPTLGDANSFSVLAGTLISSAGNASDITGDVGLDPGTGVAIGTQCAEVSGTIYDNDGAYTGAGGGVTTCLVTNAGLTLGAKNDLTTAYTALNAGENADANCIGGIYPDNTDLTTISPLGPGLYCSAGSFRLTGNINLTGSGVWVFKTVSTLITSPGSSVTGGDPCNLWWRVGSSATLDTTTAFRGNILALTAITMNNGATLSGRALARNAAVTLDTNTITNASCTTPTNNDDEDEDEDEDDEDVDIKVTKTASPSNLPSGPGSVTYTYWVTNRGDVTLKDISVEDDKCSPVTYVSGDSNRNSKLGEDESWKYTCTKRVSGTETNTVTAHGKGDGEKVHDHAKATVTVSVPGFPGAGADLNEGISNLLNNLFQKVATLLSL